ncbi:HET-domain-containing protein [Canariomyces notabilis]|uniref:HET-domain-containing protein n=1 Tax=Canariomyces notabilis TaxID=2074819 RepID=A0AAN6TE55_9PEZI|nr:HET-domain-containing protein [Canariomyces arenarius]
MPVFDGEEPCREFHKFLDLVPSYELAPQADHFIPVDASWIDLSRPRLWTSFCDHHHGGICHALPAWQNTSWPSYLILIDVEHLCLIEIRKPVTYVTLSYVWGTIPGVLETTKSNFKDLRIHGAMMHQRYLWVDRLCIVQDDPSSLEEQLGHMSSIYANSYFTIIAADGDDADYGLRGIGGGSLPRSYNQNLLRFTDHCIMMARLEDETQHNSRTTTWHRRGWTFQERILSPRNVVFFRGRLLWECRKSRWSEDVAAEPDGVMTTTSKSAIGGGHYNFTHSRWPDLRQYEHLVSSYSRRLLTYPSDGLRAFSAILARLSRTFKGGFFHGLPELYFDYGLLWYPSTPVIRRTDPTRATSFPSWSWVGWQGNVTTGYLGLSSQLVLEEMEGKNQGQMLVSIHPVVSWQKTDRHTGKNHLIINEYESWKNYANDSSLETPPGWSRVQIDTIPESASPGLSRRNWRSACVCWRMWPVATRWRRRSADKGTSRLVFRHRDIPGVNFRFPLPIGPWSAESGDDRWETQLSFESSRIFAFVGTRLRDRASRVDMKIWCNIAMRNVPFCVECTLVDADSRSV